MLTTEDRNTIIVRKGQNEKSTCYHCGAQCITNSITIDDKVFCCEGCKLVYEILNQNGLCDYYQLQNHPGLSQIKPVRSDKYSYLDNEDIASKLYKFTDGQHTIVTLYIPGVHCSSCMWLLEHLHKLNENITESRLNFTTKEVTIHFLNEKISLRQVVELMATIGYEPYISLENADKKSGGNINKERIYKLGVAGFCFGNIMMMSFPEYFSIRFGIEQQYAYLFRYFNLLLALPVFFYSASEFFVTAWKGLKQKILNIDLPIALAIVITFARSVYEIATGMGSGYLDSMSGIVFFMLVGRAVQERTYRSMSFHRDYKAYFPVAVNVVQSNGVTVSKNLHELKEKDVVQLYNDEIVPADALVIDGDARIDYSFVTGESEPVTIGVGKMVYAGGRQTAGRLTIQVTKPVAGSYLVSLWNHYAFSKNKTETNDNKSAIHVLSMYFTWILLALAVLTATWWAIKDPALIIPSVSAMLIVACPCALLLSATFTNGNILRILSNNGLFLRDAGVIEQLGNIDHIAFDKTGTLTQGADHVEYSGHRLTEQEKDWVYALANTSKHPNSKAIAAWLGRRAPAEIEKLEETAGQGISASVDGHDVRIGSAAFAGVAQDKKDGTDVFIRIDDEITVAHIVSGFREHVRKTITKLKQHYSLSLLSGDNDHQRMQLTPIFGNSQLLFEQKPIDKLHYIEQLQKNGSKVLMIGDGLNDAGALQQSNVGITLADDINNFTPSCDAILDASQMQRLPQLLALSRSAKTVIRVSFAVSVVYNVIGLAFAMRGLMKPMIAAILMPCSTLSIVLITTGLSSLAAKRLHLSLRIK